MTEPTIMPEFSAAINAGAFDNNIGFGQRPALILIDFVEAYFDKNCVLYAGVEDALASAIRVRAAARNANIPVIYTNVVYDEDLKNGGRFTQKVKPLENFVKGHPMAEWPKGFDPLPHEMVISKQYPSAFFGTSLASTLTARGIDTLIITGLSTSGCVRATCVDSCSSGFIPIVVEDAVGDRHEAPHRANLFDMHGKYGDVVREQAVIDYLEALEA